MGLCIAMSVLESRERLPSKGMNMSMSMMGRHQYGHREPPNKINNLSFLNCNHDLIIGIVKTYCNTPDNHSTQNTYNTIAIEFLLCIATRYVIHILCALWLRSLLSHEAGRSRIVGRVANADCELLLGPSLHERHHYYNILRADKYLCIYIPDLWPATGH